MIEVRSTRFKMRSSILKIMFYFMKLIGLAPFSIRTETSAEKSRGRCKIALLFSQMGLAYNILHIILRPAMSAAFFVRWLSLTSSQPHTVNYYLNILYFIVRDSASWIIVTLWCIRKRNAIHIVNRLLEIGILLRGPKNVAYGIRMFIMPVIHMIVNACSWLAVWVTSSTQPLILFSNMFINFPLTSLPVITVVFFNYQYMVVVGLVARDLERVNKNLLYFKDFQNYSSLTPFLVDYIGVLKLQPNYNWQLAALQSLRTIRTRLHELSQEIADFFSIPILFVVTFYFFSYTSSTFYAIDYVASSFEGIPSVHVRLLIHVLATTVVIIYPFMPMLANIERVLDEAQLTTDIVNELTATAMKEEVKAELEDFSLQLLREDFNFTAYGFFALDYKLLHSYPFEVALMIISRFSSQSMYSRRELF